MHVKNLRQEEFDLYIGPKTEMQSKEPLAVGQMIRTRFDLDEGKYVSMFVRLMQQSDLELAKEALTDPRDRVNKANSSAAAQASGKEKPK